MGATIIINGRTVVHKDSGGKAPSLPDFCKTPTPPGPPVPIPYINISQSTETTDGSKKVKMNGNPIMLKTSKFSTSKGDEAGTAKGVASSTTSGIAKFVNYSFDVKVEGKNVPRLGDPMTNNGNKSNTLTVKEMQQIITISGADMDVEHVRIICDAICECVDATQKGYSQNSKCVMEKLSSDPPGSQLNTTRDGIIHSEPSYDVSTLPAQILLSQTGRMTSQGIPAAASQIRALNQAGRTIPVGNVIRPDVVIARNPNLFPEGRNIRQVVEIKFRNDPRPHADDQRRSYRRISDPPKDPVVIHEDDCKCK